MLQKYFLPAGLLIVGLGAGILLALRDWWNVVEPVAWSVQMSILAIALLRSWMIEHRLESSMEQKSFQITFGLRRGYNGEGADYSLKDATKAIQEWMSARVAADLPVVTGMTSPVTLLYPVRNQEDGSRVTAEKSAVYLGSLSPKYDKGRSDTEVADTLNSLAQHIGIALGQKRVYVSFAGRQWTIDL